MSTPVINAINNVNQTSLETVFAAVAADPTARDNLSQSNQNIDSVSTNVGVIESLNNNEDAILRLLCRREGRDPANFADLAAVASDVSLIQDLSVRESTTDIITNASKANTAISADDRATREMMCHPAGLDATTFVDVADVASDNVAMTTIAADAQASRAMASVTLAMQEVATSLTAMQEVATSQTAMQAVAVSQAAMPELVASQTAMQEIAASQTAMQEIAASQTAMQEVAGSQTAMQEVAASQTAMQEIAPSQIAMEEVASSQLALDEVGNNSTVQNTVYNNNTAISALNSSPLVESRTDSTKEQRTETYKNDRVILLAQNPGASGNRSNQPQFSATDDNFPHTADVIGRGTNDAGNANPTNHNATYIDISG